MLSYHGWRHGVAVERRIRDREVAGSGLGRALWRKTLSKFLTPVHDGDRYMGKLSL